MAMRLTQRKTGVPPVLLVVSLGAGLLAAGLTHQWLAQQRTTSWTAPQVSGRRLTVSQPGTPIHTGMAATLPPSARAITIAIDPISGVAGFAQPGDHVDILATLDTASNQSVTRTVLQDILLLALGSKKPEENETPKPADLGSATIMVSPAQAQIVALAQAHGHLQLSLCPAEAPQPAHLSAVSLTSLARSATVSSSVTVPRPHDAPQGIHARQRNPISAPPIHPIVLPSVPTIHIAPTIMVVHGTTVQALTVSH